jgi:hypothetical protein
MMRKSNKTVLRIVRLFNIFANIGMSRDKSILSLSLSIGRDCDRWVSCEGKPGLDRFKAISSYIIRRTMGLSPKKPDLKISRKYSHVIRLLDKGGNLEVLYLVSVLHCYRLVTLPIDFSVATIIKPFSGSVRGLREHRHLLLKTCRILKETFSIKPFSANFKWAVSGASGPNGSPAYRKSREDLVALNSGKLTDKVVKAFQSLKFNNSSEFEYYFADLSRYKTISTETKDLFHSRLAFLQDKGGKTRVVGLVDLLTQSLLKPVHDHVASILRHLPTDGTFDQEIQRQRVKEWTKQGLYLASLDLSACTDRFPAFFQMMVLVKTGVFDLKQGLAWLELIRGRDFAFRKKGDETYSFVRYEVGQPMGAYSSWPVMALAHHALVQLSYNVAYPSRDVYFDKYALLGDDIVIADKKVAETYKVLISHLGIDYSPSKSFETYGVAEFAKSLFSFGKDLTPFPLALMLMKENTIVTDTLALMDEFAKRKLVITDISAITLPFVGTRTRNLMRVAILSPKSNKSALPYLYRGMGDDDLTFSVLLLSRKLDSFLSYKAWNESVNLLVMWTTKMEWKYIKGQGRIGGLVDPLRVLHQIGQDNSENYPILNPIFDEAIFEYRIFVGYGFICYDPNAWPLGIKHLSIDILRPGPTWTKEADDTMFRSTLIKLDKLFPGYFEPRCVKHTYKITTVN